MTQSKDSLVKLAFITHPHGLKGEAELRLLNPDTDETILEEGMKVWLFPASPKSKISSQGEEWTINKLRFGNKVICHFEGIKDRTHLETLMPFDLYLDRASFPEADDGEVYLVDLVGLKVIGVEGEELGRLESFSDNGMQYLFDVRLLTGEVLTLPYVESFFPTIDMENKTITMIMPEFTE